MIYEQTQTLTTIIVPSVKERLWRRFGEMLRTNASPQTVAGSFAVGTFVSILPTPGLNIALLALLGARFKGLNKAAMLAAVGVWNTLVVAPLYALSFQIGEWLFGLTPVTLGTAPLPQALLSISKSFLVGNVIIAAAITAVSYILVKTAVQLYQES